MNAFTVEGFEFGWGPVYLRMSVQYSKIRIERFNSKLNSRQNHCEKIVNSKKLPFL